MIHRNILNVLKFQTGVGVRLKASVVVFPLINASGRLVTLRAV